MKIKVNDKKVKFSEISVGEPFQVEGRYYLKTRDFCADGCKYNCVDLQNGNLKVHISQTCLRVDGEFVVKDA